MDKIKEISQNPIIVFIWLFLTLPSFTLLVVFVVAWYISKCVGLYNPIVIQLLDVSSSIVISFVTILYVIFTWEIVKQAKKSFKETKIDRQIRYIEKQLEMFYHPLSLHLSVNENLIPAENLVEISKYHYLAMDPAYDRFRYYLNNNHPITERIKAGNKLKEAVDEDISDLLMTLKYLMHLSKTILPEYV